MKSLYCSLTCNSLVVTDDVGLHTDPFEFITLSKHFALLTLLYRQRLVMTQRMHVLYDNVTLFPQRFFLRTENTSRPLRNCSHLRREEKRREEKRREEKRREEKRREEKRREDKRREGNKKFLVCIRQVCG
jgi:hypothetical protein